MYKVISGGQTGIDQIGLKAALESGISTGGWAPKDFMTFDGPQYELSTLYGLESCDGGYTLRTKMNVTEADLTLIFADQKESVGTKVTIKYLREHRKNYFMNCFDFDGTVRYILSNKVKTINIAGNRANKLTDETKAKVEKYLIRLFTFLRRREIRNQQVEVLQATLFPF